MAGLENLPLKCGPTPHEIAHAFLGLGRHVHGGEFAGPEQPRELRRVVFVVLALDARPRRDQRRRNDCARDAPVRELALQDAPRARGVIARPQGGDRPEPLEVPAELLQVRGQLVNLRGVSRIAREHGDGDGLLVHIEDEEEC